VHGCVFGNNVGHPPVQRVPRDLFRLLLLDALVFVSGRNILPARPLRSRRHPLVCGRGQAPRYDLGGQAGHDDTVWQYFSVGDGMLGAMVGCNLYGGYSIPVVEVLMAGQRRFLTNGMLDAALVELREHCMGLSSASAVLMTNQSASFIATFRRDVSEEDARGKMREVLGVLPSRPYVRYVMLLNLINKHWISAEVLIHSGTINVFDSASGSYSQQKAEAVRRVVLFAEKASRFLRTTDASTPTWEA